MTFLYYFKLIGEERTCYKIGVTSDISKRARQISKSGYKAKMLMVENFDSKLDAYKAESLIKRAFKEYRVSISADISCYTETFDRDVLKLDTP